MDPRLYKFDLQKSPVDPRDFMLETIYPDSITLPTVWDLRPQMRPIRDQGNEGTCSAQASAAMKEWQEFSDVGLKEHMSPWFVYQLRENMGQAGMYPRNTMEILYKIGIVTEKDYPYLNNRPITDELKTKAGTYKIQGYAQINTLDSLKKALFANGPCYIAFPVYNPEKMKFWKPDYTGQEMIGGHACFTKDTKISLMNGKELNFEQLINEYKDKNFYVYSIDENGNTVPGLAHSPRLTSKNAKIIKITLDNGEIIKCTEDHNFLLKNNTYKFAKELTTEDSLMPLYRKITTNKMVGYEQCLNNNTNKWEYTHILSAFYMQKIEKNSKNVIHHIDFNKRNNDPINLRLMDKKEHWELHMGYYEHLKKWVKSEEGRKFLSDNAKKMWIENKEFKEKTSQVLRDQGNKTQQKLKDQGRDNPWVEWAKNNPDKAFLMNSENGKKNIKYANTKEAKEKAKKTYKEHIKNDAEFKAKVVNQYTKNFKKYNDKISSGELKTPEYYNKKRLTALKIAYRDYKYKKYDTFDDYLKKEKGLTLSDGILLPFNHKIVNIEFYGYEDVYDITVEKYNNFALSSGVFVHNCTVAGYLKDNFIIRNSWSAQWGDQGYTYYPFAQFGMHWEIWTAIDADSNPQSLSDKANNVACSKSLFRKLFGKKVIK